MALNIVDIPNHALGFGLDYRVNINEVQSATTLQLYATSDDLPTTEYPVDILTQDYYFPTSAVAMQISSDDVSDNQQVTIYYYPDNATSEPLIQQVTLTGQTPVNIPSNIYRISRAIITSPSLNSGNVYIYGTGATVTSGVPDSEIICTLKPNIGFSQQSYVYIPAEWKGYLTNVNLINNSTSTNEINIKVYRLISSALPSYRYLVQNMTLCNGAYNFSETNAPGIASDNCYLVKASKSNASETGRITLVYNFVLFK